MMPDTVEWHLRQLVVGTEILIHDEHNKPIARGLLNQDRVSLSGPNGERFRLDSWRDGWEVVVLRQPKRVSGPRPAPRL